MFKGIFNKQAKKNLSPEEIVQQTRGKTAQQWIPVVDIEGPVVYRKDNLLVAMLRIQPENLDLLSDREQRRKIDLLAEQLNGETEGLQIFCIGRPVDLDNYLEWLRDKAKLEQDFTRKMILKGYIKQAAEMASSGETTERRFYIVVTKPVGHKAASDLLNKLNDLQNKLYQAELSAAVCQDEELLDVFALFANPTQASFERTEMDFMPGRSTILDLKDDLDDTPVPMPQEQFSGETTGLSEATGVLSEQGTPHLLRSSTLEKVQINKLVFRLGKEPMRVDYCIDSNTHISRGHADILFKEEGFFIRDNNSLNGTFVNGSRVIYKQEVKLKHDDRITLANEQFVFKLY